MKAAIIGLFQIPENFALLEVASRLKRVLQYHLHIAPLSQFERLQTQEMIDYLLQIPAATVPKRSRASLHNHLKSAPFLATLFLLDEPSDDLFYETLLNQQFALLTHLYEVRALHDYAAYLQFFKSMIEHAMPTLPLHQLLELTTREVHQQLSYAATQHQHLTNVVPFFLKAQRLQSSTQALLAAENHHVYAIDDSLEYVETSTRSGEESLGILQLVSELSLSNEQQRRHFRFKIAGAQRAFYTSENAVPLGMQAALPAEVFEFLELCAPSLLRGNTTVIVQRETGYWLVFLLKLFGVPTPLDLKLTNLLAEKLVLVQSQNYIAYQLEKEGLFISAELNLRADLLNTESPIDADRRIHYVASERLRLTVPSNILELLNVTLRAIESGSRHGVTLQNALRFDENDYRLWLKAKLKNTSLPNRGIGIAQLHRSFLQFSKHTIPETYRAFLSRKAVIQNHYVSAEPHQISSTILRAWRDFCEKSGIRWSHVDALETAKFAVTRQFHREVGSKITLREELLIALYAALLDSAALNKIAFYIYLRIATTSALRPVREPFPEVQHIDLSVGYMTVADKRVHSDDERRFVVLTSSACQLLISWRKYAECYSHQNLIEVPSHGLMWLDDQKCWQHFDSKTVNLWLYEHTKQSLKSHSFRHSAAHRFLLSGRQFDQRMLNFLMNHSRAGVGLLDRFSSLSPVLAAALLRHELQSLEAQFLEFDAKALAALEAM